MNIAFIGGGNMASALIGGILQRGFSGAQIKVNDINEAAGAELQRRLGVAVHAEIEKAIAGADCIVLAVKPQQLRSAAASLAALLSSQLVVSIAAGVRCSDLSRWLGGYTRIVRVMPNTPALVSSGVSGLFAMPDVRPDERDLVARIFAAVGVTLWLEREEQMDAITAVSGSGPAYLFYFIEALQSAARELGLSDSDARVISVATFAGAAKLAAQSSEDAATLRARVTSKGGTTERALMAMEQAQVKQQIVRAVHAAARRSAELGDELGRD